MAMLEVGPPARKSAHRPPWWVVACAVLVVTVAAVGGWNLWYRGTHKVRQAAAKDEAAQALDAMVQSVGANRPDYDSKIVLERCDNGKGGYNSWQVYSIVFEGSDQTRSLGARISRLGAVRRAAISRDLPDTLQPAANNLLQVREPEHQRNYPVRSPRHRLAA